MKAPPFLASKWLHFDLLVGVQAIKELFKALGEPLYQLSTLGVAKKGEHEISQERFCEEWTRYLDRLKSGQEPPDSEFRFFFTSCLTRSLEAVFVMDVGSGREIISPIQPLLQMQLHRFHYSKDDAKFHSMSFGEATISWGIRISYPQLFQFPDTRAVVDATDEEQFYNALLLSRLKSWVRKYTQPTPFMIDGKKVYEPMRIDKECLGWIKSHAGLKEKGLEVAL